jgi:hypothetical protein
MYSPQFIRLAYEIYNHERTLAEVEEGLKSDLPTEPYYSYLRKLCYRLYARSVSPPRFLHLLSRFIEEQERLEELENSYFSWFDDGSATLEKKIKVVLVNYRRRYSTLPQECLVSDTYRELPQIEGLIINTAKYVEPNFVWLKLPVSAETEVANVE